MTDSNNQANGQSIISPNILEGLSHELKAFMKYKDASDSDSNDKRLEFETLIVLESLGYPINNMGIYYFRDLIVKACLLREEGISDIELYSLLNDEFSQFYFDVARNENDIGIKNFNSTTCSCLEKRNKSSNTNKLAFKIMRRCPEENSLGINVFFISDYIYGKHLNSKEQGKPYVKKLNFKNNI